MRLGTSSPLAHASAAEWAKHHKSLGLTAINFPLNCEDDAERIRDYAEAAKNCGLEIAEVGVWRNTLDADKEKREQAVAFAAGQLRLADELGARCCVNILGTPGAVWDGAYKENFSQEIWDQGVKSVQEIIDRVQPKNTYYTIEPMPWMVPTGPEEYLRFIEAVDRDRFAVHMDLFNWMTTPKRYFYNEEFAERSFELLGKYVRSCHIKDVMMSRAYTMHFQECAPGEGEINIRHLIDTAVSYDQDMSFIIEHLDTDEAYLKSVRYVQGLLQ